MKPQPARDTLRQFRLAREIGRGATGIVYEAFDPEVKRTVALKTLASIEDPNMLVRFKREFRLLKALAHPNIVALEELYSENNEWFFTMELVDGVEFLTYVRRGLVTRSSPHRDDSPHAPPSGGYSDTKLRDALAQLVGALDAMHERGIVHRDIKPSNVLVTLQGRVVVLDFGVAADLRGVHAGGASTYSVVGTPAYMAPELVLAEGSSGAADMYSVGVMLFEALTGKRPIEGTPMEVMAKKLAPIARAPHELVASIPRDLSDLAMDMLAQDPERRPTASDVLQRLGAAAASLSGEWSSAAKKKGVFVGRETELAALDDAYAAAREGSAATVVVRGESGIGKTVLVRQFLTKLEASAPDAVILNGRCRENEWIPFKAIDGVMDDLARMLETSGYEGRAILPRRADRLAQVFPTFRPVVTMPRVARDTSEDPIEQRSQLIASVRELFLRLGERYPVVVVIDDVQWADADSLAVLNELTRPPDAPSLTLLVTLRSEATREPLKEPALARARVLDLERLSVADSVALAREMASGASASPPGVAPLDAEAIAREAQGHPMFIAELVRYSSLAKPDAALLRLDDALGERLGALDESARTVLRLIALTGRPTPLAFVKQAASLGFEDVTRIVSMLRGIHALRVSRARGDRLEPYHDRVREVVLAAVTEPERRDLHRRIATTLEAAKDLDPEALALHWRGAGDEVRALAYALEAAQAASAALAFDHAAELYERILSSSHIPPAEEQRIAEKLGDALVNAGRGVRAAAAYRRAARGAPVANALDLERRAADQLLRAGHFDEGLAAIRAVLASIGMSLPETPFAALVLFVVGRLFLRVRGLGFKRRDASEIAATELMRVDVCRSVSFGLGIVDTVRGAAFQVRALRLALRAGEIKRIALALASESAYLARSGGPSFLHVTQLADRARALADETGDAHAIGWAQVTRGCAYYLNGRFAEALTLLRGALDTWRRSSAGLAWEISSGHLFTTSSLAQLGELRRLSEELPRVLRDAFDRGDRYAAVSFRIGLPNLYWLVADQPKEAELQIREAMSEWSKQGFHLEHFYELIALTNIDLYADRPREAFVRISERWTALRNSLLPLTVQSTRILSGHLRARSALAAVDDGANVALLRVARRSAHHLEREAMPWSLPLAKLIRAALAWKEGAESSSVTLLRGAVTDLEAIDMKLHAAAARHRLGALLGGDEGRELVRASDEWMKTEGVKNGGRIVAMVAPGFARRAG